jgi:hypothetical protein
MDDNEAAGVVAARQALHAVAEHVLAGPQWRHSGTIKLAVTDHRITTTQPVAPGIETLELSGRDVVARPGGTAVPLLGSVRALGEALGVVPGAPAGLYREGASLGADDELDVDPDAAGAVLAALTMGAAALAQLDPRPAVLWPEHFDVGITLDEVNYGVSPGDADHDLPYAYVGPWTARQGSFWNEPFGASRPVADLKDADGVLAFFREARQQAG